jgi:hypothetical protein
MTEYRVVYPAQCRFEKPKTKNRASWVLDIAGPFCYWTRPKPKKGYDSMTSCNRLVHLKSQLSSLTFLSVNAAVINGIVLDCKILVPVDTFTEIVKSMGKLPANSKGRVLVENLEHVMISNLDNVSPLSDGSRSHISV